MKAIRKILNIETETVNYSGIGQVKLKYVLWCVPSAETSRSFKTDTIRLTVLGGGASKTDARFFRKQVTIAKNSPIESVNKLALKHWNRLDLYSEMRKDVLRGSYDFHGFATELYCHKMGGQRFTGEVRYENTDDHYSGLIQTEFGQVHYYRCNFEKSDSMYPQLTTNIECPRGSIVSFEVPSDPYLFKHCGVINLRVEQVATEKAV